MTACFFIVAHVIYSLMLRDSLQSPFSFLFHIYSGDATAAYREVCCWRPLDGGEKKKKIQDCPLSSHNVHAQGFR